MDARDTDALFARVAALRRELADLVESLTEEQLATPSHCGEWDVRTAAAHLTVLPTVSRLRFATTAVKQRGDMDRTIDVLSRDAARRSPAEVAATLRQVAGSRAVPPMLGPIAPYADLVVHLSDIRRPLGLSWEPDPVDVEATLDFLAGAPIGFGPRGRLKGINLVATDLGRSWRDGAEVSGPASDLVLAICARPGALDRVDGPGKALLADRG